MIEHKHLVVRAEVGNPVTDPDNAKIWLRRLVDKIGMKLINVEGNPLASYISTPGNRGLTAVAIIETSHVTLHTWDEIEPALFQLDVYTCSDLDPIDVFDSIEEFDVRSKSYMFLDRRENIHQTF